jgi:hypothetical protein
MSTAITQYVNATLEEKKSYVQMLAAAGDLLPPGLWANTKNPETGLMENRPSPGKVMLIVETGLMLGLHPMAALRGIDVIEGNPTLKPSLMSALIRQAGHTLRIEQTGTVEGGDISVTCTGIRSDDPEHPYVYTWTPADALRAGLLDSYEPDAGGVWRGKARSKTNNPKPWESYMPRLLRWRSLSDVASAGFEDVLMGMHYTAEEMGAVVNEREEVETVDADLEPTEDWAALVAEATTKDELLAIGKRADALGEYTDQIRTLVLTKVGKLGRDVVIEEPATEAEPVSEAEPEPATPTDADYEAQAAAEAEAGR